MKFFATIKANFRRCLYYPNQPRIFSAKRLLASFAAFLTIGSHVLFLCYETDDIEEYVFSGYFITTFLGVFLSFIDTTLKTNKIFSAIDEFENAGNDSE